MANLMFEAGRIDILAVPQAPYHRRSISGALIVMAGLVPAIYAFELARH
jgi:hypothetical protein